MELREYLKNNIIYLDGGMGTLLQKKGLMPGELPERWNLTHSDIITAIHKSYFDSGSNIVSANTFGANSLKFSDEELEVIIKAAVANAFNAKALSTSKGEKWIALDIGPTGRMLAPYGDFDFEDAVSVFAKTVKLGVKYGVDLIFIETMNDSYETKAALLAAKENSDLPVFVSNAYGEDGKLMTGASPSSMVALLEGMGADAIGLNCAFGPKALFPVLEEYLKYSSIPVIFKPNAGLPRSEGGVTVYDVSDSEFSEDVTAALKKGARLVGGCCGTTPSYIEKLVLNSKSLNPVPVTKKDYTVVSSYTHSVLFGEKPVLIGERINPTGKKRFKTALLENDIDYILKEGVSQQDNGVDLLDVNVGLPEIDEPTMLKSVVTSLQAIIDLPLCIDTSNPVAMEAALRRYNGKALINSVNGKKESMDSVFPLAKKYSGVIIALTLDENGIPSSCEGRFKIAEKILKEAQKYGISKKDIIFDPLALTISADSSSGMETLNACSMISEKLGVCTSLGVSNISFGLPERDIINSTFFALSLEHGLSAAIMNPYSLDMMKAYHAFCAIHGMDKNCTEYIEFSQTLPKFVTEEVKGLEKKEDISGLEGAISKGLSEYAAKLTSELLCEMPALEIIRTRIIPALDKVGTGFENKTVYLPQLLMSAEAAKASFEVIKNAAEKPDSEKCKFVIATVKGDIHDIGKNIVKLLLENYGFDVADLGRDVAPETVLESVLENNAPLLGLSALMTTTVPAMEETIRLVKKNAPSCKIVVGGAVLTEDYASSIGADKYAKDAMETVRYAEEIYKSL